MTILLKIISSVGIVGIVIALIMYVKHVIERNAILNNEHEQLLEEVNEAKSIIKERENNYSRDIHVIDEQLREFSRKND